MSKQTICLDFDGVIHSYASGWMGADVVLDPPVDGAGDAIQVLIDMGYEVAVYSSRSGQDGGLAAMLGWWNDHDMPRGVTFPKSKPPAMLYVDDRGYRFDGDWQALIDFTATKMLPWNKEG